MKKNSFDGIAPFYDRLARLVFGRALSKAKRRFLGRINSSDRVLILGGGTGEELEVLLKMNNDQHIDYVEASEKMIKRSKRRIQNLSYSHLRFFHQTDLAGLNTYNVIITSFFLDLFSEEDLHKRGHEILDLLVHDGSWLVTEFTTDSKKTWHSALVSIMYLFFRWTTGLRTSGLADFDRFFKNAGMTLEIQDRFFYGMVKSQVFRRQ